MSTPVNVELDDPQPGDVTACTGCGWPFTVPPEGQPETYPCGERPFYAVECVHCIAIHVEYCAACARAIAESEES